MKINEFNRSFSKLRKLKDALDYKFDKALEGNPKLPTRGLMLRSEMEDDLHHDPSTHLAAEFDEFE